MFGIIVLFFSLFNMVAVIDLTFGQVSYFFLVPLIELGEIMAHDQYRGSESAFILVGSIRI
jgi:hypothetical protein